MAGWLGGLAPRIGTGKYLHSIAAKGSEASKAGIGSLAQLNRTELRMAF